jgi:hypothetical protein
VIARLNELQNSYKSEQLRKHIKMNHREKCDDTKWSEWIHDTEFEILTAAVMKSTIFWDITQRSPLKVNRCFGGAVSAFHIIHAGSLLGLLLDPEDGGDMFL